jgi:hypothetical protein
VLIADETRVIMDRIVDCGLLRHGFTDYMRDYELLIDHSGGTRLPGMAEGYRVLFRNCVYAEAQSSVASDVWLTSLGDEQLQVDTALEDADGQQLGYVWGVRWQNLYPGGDVVDDSSRAADWTVKVGMKFCEVSIEANAHNIRLVYSGISIEHWDPATLKQS